MKAWLSCGVWWSRPKYAAYWFNCIGSFARGFYVSSTLSFIEARDCWCMMLGREAFPARLYSAYTSYSI